VNTSRLRHILLSFTTGQGALQAIQIVSGFVLVRYMDVHEYGVAAFLLAVQGAAAALSDIGLRDGIVAIAGKDTTDKEKLGRLIGAAIHQRRINLVPVTIGILIAFALLYHFQNVSLSTILVLSSTSVAFAVFNGWNVYFAMPFVLSHDMKAYYLPQLTFQTLRLALLLTALALNLLDVAALAIINLFSVIGSGLWYKNKSAKTISMPSIVFQEDIHHMRRYIAPLAPMTLFAAFQDQILIFIMSAFGQTANLAQIFALGRLGALFQFFSSATTNLAMPWLARASNQELSLRFFIVFGGALLVAIAVTLGAIIAPDAYLWILGSNYSGLRFELLLAVSSASLSFLASILYLLNNSRNWLWPYSGASWIILVIPLQVVCVVGLDMTVTRGGLLMSLFVSLAALLFHAFHTFLGFTIKNRTPAR